MIIEICSYYKSSEAIVYNLTYIIYNTSNLASLVQNNTVYYMNTEVYTTDISISFNNYTTQSCMKYYLRN